MKSLCWTGPFTRPPPPKWLNFILWFIFGFRLFQNVWFLKLFSQSHFLLSWSKRCDVSQYRHHHRRRNPNNNKWCHLLSPITVLFMIRLTSPVCLSPSSESAMSSALCFNDVGSDVGSDVTTPQSIPAAPDIHHNDSSNLFNHKLSFDLPLEQPYNFYGSQPTNVTNWDQEELSNKDNSFSPSESRTNLKHYGGSRSQTSGNQLFRGIKTSTKSNRRRIRPPPQPMMIGDDLDDNSYEDNSYREHIAKVVRPRFPHPKGSVFIPVAAYSITKRKPSNKKKSPWTSTISRSSSSPSLAYHRHRGHIPMSSSSSNRHRILPSASSSIRRQKLRPYHSMVPEEELISSSNDNEEEELDEEESANEEDYETKKESAVYGYLRKPEIIEFRGQYYYGNTGSAVEDGGGKVPFGDGNSMIELDDGTNQHQQQMMEQQPSTANKYDTKVDYQDEQIHQIGNYQQQQQMARPQYQQPHQYHHRHRVSSGGGYMPAYESGEHFDSSMLTTGLILKKIKKILFVKGLTIKGLLLASLPLIFTPVLSYLLTPVVIPITANVAAGRRRRRRRSYFDSDYIDRQLMTSNQTSTASIQNRSSLVEPLVYDQLTTTQNRIYRSKSIDNRLLDAKVLFDYLDQVTHKKTHHSKRGEMTWTTNAVAKFLQCRGFLLLTDHCLEQLSCEFAASETTSVSNSKLQYNGNKLIDTSSNLERSVTSMILGHLLRNEFIRDKFKKRLKQAAQFGQQRSTTGGSTTSQCKLKYPCNRIQTSASRDS